MKQLMKRTGATMLLVILSVGAQAADQKVKLDPKEEKELAKALEGKVAGKPVNCVSSFSGNNLQAIGDNILVYRVSKKLTYRNDLIGTCHGLKHGDTLVLNVYGSQYCRGDMARAVDLNSGMMGGTCALGEFVPYVTAEAGKASN